MAISSAEKNLIFVLDESHIGFYHSMRFLVRRPFSRVLSVSLFPGLMQYDESIATNQLDTKGGSKKLLRSVAHVMAAPKYIHVVLYNPAERPTKSGKDKTRDSQK